MVFAGRALQAGGTVSGTDPYGAGKAKAASGRARDAACGQRMQIAVGSYSGSLGGGGLLDSLDGLTTMVLGAWP